MPLQLPRWLDLLPEDERKQAKLRFLVKLAAIYATSDGSVAELSRRCGLSPNSLAAMSTTQPQITGELAVCIERLAEHPQITREAFRPDLFVKV